GYTCFVTPKILAMPLNSRLMIIRLIKKPSLNNIICPSPEEYRPGVFLINHAAQRGTRSARANLR
ncbi:hypothetical protein, partial [Klebsiella grimontii]|uniref:hypothetical protein n=1 Tax=Klebsiella grimontii TaxID=2058152 RepID=UPI0025A10A27